MTDKERQEALVWTKELNWSHIKLEAQDLQFNMGCYKKYIIEALDEYGRTKMVTRKWIENKTNRLEQLFMNRHRRQDREFFISHEILKELGVTIAEAKTT